MTGAKKTPTRRQQLLAEAARLGSEFSSQTIFFHETVSSKLGLNPTDSKCLGLISHMATPVTAGWLAEATGLTTGAITGILDRLEKAGLIQRVRDQADRRKVYIQLHPDGHSRFGPLYQGLSEAVTELILSYSEAELETIGDFMTRSIAMLREQADKLRES